MFISKNRLRELEGEILLNAGDLGNLARRIGDLERQNASLEKKLIEATEMLEKYSKRLAAIEEIASEAISKDAEIDRRMLEGMANIFNYEVTNGRKEAQ